MGYFPYAELELNKGISVPCRLVPAKDYYILVLTNFIYIYFFVVFSHLSFHIKFLCIVNCMINCSLLVAGK